MRTQIGVIGAAMLSLWSAGCETPPPPPDSGSVIASAAGPTSASTPPAGPSEADPTSSAAAQPEPADLTIDCECRSGAQPAPPAKPPLVSRRVIIEPDGTMKQIVRYLNPPTDEKTTKLGASEVVRLNDLARELYVKKDSLPAAEAPVPDGTVCTIRIARGAPQLTLVVPHPSSNPELAPLVDALVKLLPQP